MRQSTALRMKEGQARQLIPEHGTELASYIGALSESSSRMGFMLAAVRMFMATEGRIVRTLLTVSAWHRSFL